MKKDSKAYILHDSIHMIIWKRGNYWDENQISGCQILGKVDYKRAMQGIFIVIEMFNMLLWFEYMTMHLSKSTDKDVVKGITQLKAKGTVQNDHCINW